MGEAAADLLSRYLQFADDVCEMNRALSSVKPWVSKAYAADPSGESALYLMNDLALFLLEVMAFDGFLTACLHALGRGREEKSGSIVDRFKRLTGTGPDADGRLECLVSHLREIEMVRDAWVHGQGSASVLKSSKWPRHVRDRFGVDERDGRLWVHLSHRAKDGRVVWSHLMNTLKDAAVLVWASCGPIGTASRGRL